VISAMRRRWIRARRLRTAVLGVARAPDEAGHGPAAGWRGPAIRNRPTWLARQVSPLSASYATTASRPGTHRVRRQRAPGCPRPARATGREGALFHRLLYLPSAPPALLGWAPLTAPPPCGRPCSFCPRVARCPPAWRCSPRARCRPQQVRGLRCRQPSTVAHDQHTRCRAADAESPR